MASKPPQPSVLPGTGIGIGGDGQDDVQRHAIRYASLYHQQYVRFFNGHTGKVTHLSLCPANDSFLSSSVDQTVREGGGAGRFAFAAVVLVSSRRGDFRGLRCSERWMGGGGGGLMMSRFLF